jgi:hydroxyacylglutathione hydrolase
MEEKMANVAVYPVGALRTNAYVVSDRGEACIIDPAASGGLLAAAVGDNLLKYIILTHGHIDHFAALDDVVRDGCQVCIHRLDLQLVKSPALNGSQVMGIPQPATIPDLLLDEGTRLTLGGMELSVISTPGHTPGGISIMVDRLLFTGDTLFAGSVGRTDLYGGDSSALMRSLHRLKSLKGDYVIHPGHGPETSLSAERANNPFLREDSE